MSVDLALLVFDHVEGAERAYADVGASVDSPCRLVRHHLSPQAAQALEGADVGRPRVIPPVGE